MKRMIFHLPIKVDTDRYSASQIRPQKMLQAFKSIGYDVDVVTGYAKERKAAIKRIKDNIKRGVKYDFVYSESSTMPTLLTERHHYPTHPFVDFNFFRFCKKNGIKIGLFYRDIFWCFPENILNWKNKIARYFYLYDLKQYQKYLDILFLPSLRMVKYLPIRINIPLVELPSGTTLNISEKSESKEQYIRIVYVGGFGKVYDMETLLKVVREIPSIKLTICCREDDWNAAKKSFISLISSNISVIHKHGDELEELYKDADLGSFFVKPSIYLDFAMPFKIMEYIGHGCPVLSSKGTMAAHYVEENNIGIVAQYDYDSLYKTLSSLTRQNMEIMKQKTREFAITQTWNDRAMTAANLLSDYNL